MNIGNLLIMFIAEQTGAALFIFPVVTIVMRDKNGQRPALTGANVVYGMLATGISIGFLRLIVFYILGGKIALHQEGSYGPILSLILTVLVSVGICALMKSKVELKLLESKCAKNTCNHNDNVSFASRDVNNENELKRTIVDNEDGESLIENQPTNSKNIKGNLKNKSEELSVEHLDKLYEQALIEYEDGKAVKSLHSRAIVVSDGDKSKERSEYIKTRVENLKKEVIDKENNKKTHEKEANFLEKKEKIGNHGIFVEGKNYKSIDEAKNDIKKLAESKRLIKEKAQDINLMTLESVERNMEYSDIIDLYQDKIDIINLRIRNIKKAFSPVEP